MVSMILYLITGPTGKQYCGITKRGSERRWYHHVYTATRGKRTHLSAAIRKYGPDAFVLETIGEADTWEELCEMEVKEIRERGLQDPQLGYNHTAGGEGLNGYRHSEESRDRMSAAQTGIKRAPRSRESILRAAESNRGRKRTPEQCARISAAKVGHKHTEETKRKISKTLTGRPGHKHTEESLKKLSDSLKLAWATDRPRKATAEHRRKISEGLKKYWARIREEMQNG